MQTRAIYPRNTPNADGGMNRKAGKVVRTPFQVVDLPFHTPYDEVNAVIQSYINQLSHSISLFAWYNVRPQNQCYSTETTGTLAFHCDPCYIHK
jgi:hypothetical protein